MNVLLPPWLVLALLLAAAAEGPVPRPFGEGFPDLDQPAVGEWWEARAGGSRPRPPEAAWLDDVVLNVPRDQTIAFALYTIEHGALKLTAQLVPLLPDEPRTVRLEFHQEGDVWKEFATAEVVYPGWTAHFRIDRWHSGFRVPYRVCHGANSFFEGVVRKDPADKDVIVVGLLSSSANRACEPPADLVRNLRRQDPDLVFFAGDQSREPTMHTAGWLRWGKQFRELTKDRPVVTLPGDHDVGHERLWGEGGIAAADPTGAAGGYLRPADYVRMVERCQTAHLPDAHDPAPVAQGIGVHYTRLRVGGVDFAILEDRKFKSGPEGKVPRGGPQPGLVTDPACDRRALDGPGLELLGERQLGFLAAWGDDWSGAEMKAVLSRGALCGAAHLHGAAGERLLADLGCNGWPRGGRDRALAALRRCRAVHLCGDPQPAAVVQHGIEAFRDAPFGFTGPAVCSEGDGRWWWPADGKPGANPRPGCPLPWTGDYLDGLGNRVTMLAYANPGGVAAAGAAGPGPGEPAADGYGIVRFDKRRRAITFECWPRTGDLAKGLKQYPGWPLTVKMEDNDGRRPAGTLKLPEKVKQIPRPVISVLDEATGETLHTQRYPAAPAVVPVFGTSRFTIRYGRDKPDQLAGTGLKAE